MIWNIYCRKIRRLLALSAGNDLEQREWHVAERHLAVCPSCREVWVRLQQSLQVLERARPAPLEDVERVPAVWPPVSVWPSVARHVRMLDKQAVKANWRDWLPAGAIAAACVAIISVTLSEMPVDDSVSPALIMSSPAAFDPNPRHLEPRHLGPFPLGLHRDGSDRRNEHAGTLDAGKLEDDDPPSF
jgi:hypothetical protein